MRQVFGERYSENLPKIKSGTDAFEASHPIGSTVGKMALGTAALAPLGAVAPIAKGLGMAGTLPEMVGYGMVSNAAIGGADAAARGEDIGKGAMKSAIAGGVLPFAGRGVGMIARGARNLVSPAPRLPRTVDLNGVSVPVPESYVHPDNHIGSQEQQALSGAIGPEAQRIAQEAKDATEAQTQTAAHGFGDEMRGSTEPVQPLADKQAAAGQTITELAQQHNDQITAQARHDAQIAAEGTSLRHDPAAPLGAPEPVQPHAATDAVAHVQEGMQEAGQRAQQN